MEVHELRLLKGDLGMTSVVVNLHGLQIGRGGLAVRALVLGVAALIGPGPVRLTGLAAASVRRRRVDLRGYLLGRVLLRLGLPGHGSNLI